MTGGAALLFDLDGTLVDSDAKHLAAFQRVFAPFGITVDQALYNKGLHGASNELIGKVFLSHLSPERQRATLEEKEAAYRADLADIEPLAGAVELLDRPVALSHRPSAHRASASRSVAFEDSPSGVRAAAGAGLAVVGLTTTLDEAALIEAGAALAAKDFTDARIFALIEARLGADVKKEACV